MLEDTPVGCIDAPGRHSALNRLKKAAALGIGPLREVSQGQPDVLPTDRAVKKKSSRKPRAEEDVADVSAFLGGGPKRPAKSNAKVAGEKAPQPTGKSISIASISASGLSFHTRAKAAARPSGEKEHGDEEHEEEQELEEGELREEARERSRSRDRDRDRERDRDRDREREPRGGDVKEERRKRDEWRKQHRAKKRVDDDGRGRARRRPSSDVEVDEQSSQSVERAERSRKGESPTRGSRREAERQAEAARNWTEKNASKVASKYGKTDPGLGQLTDRDLDKRLGGEAGSSSSGLMSEAEVMKKLKAGALSGRRDSWAER